MFVIGRLRYLSMSLSEVMRIERIMHRSTTFVYSIGKVWAGDCEVLKRFGYVAI